MIICKRDFWSVVTCFVCLLSCGTALAASGQSRLQQDESLVAEISFLRANAIWEAEGTNVDDVKRLLNKAISIWQGQTTSDELGIAAATDSLGRLEYNGGNYPQAEKYFRKAFEIQSRILGAESIQAGLQMGNVGATLRNESRYDEAHVIVEHSMALRRKYLSQNDPMIADGLHNLGLIYYRERKYLAARRAFQEMFEINLANHEPVDEDRALVRAVDEVIAIDQRQVRLTLMSAAIVFLSLVAMFGSQSWLENFQIENPANDPWIPQTFVGASRFAYVISAGFVGMFVGERLLIRFASSMLDDGSHWRMIVKAGFFIGVWLSIFLMQILDYGRLQLFGKMGRPVMPLGLGLSHGGYRGHEIASRSESRSAQSGIASGHETWFAAMEYYALMLNRTYKVFVTDRMLCGAKVRGIVLNPHSASQEMMNQTYWVQTPSAQVYDRIDVTSGVFLQVNSANFQIGWGQIVSIEYRAGRKWGMGNVPHSGRLILNLKAGKQKELILLGYQDGEGLKRRLERYLMPGNDGVGFAIPALAGMRQV